MTLICACQFSTLDAGLYSGAADGWLSYARHRKILAPEKDVLALRFFSSPLSISATMLRLNSKEYEEASNVVAALDR
jgi:hypothetical protein